MIDVVKLSKQPSNTKIAKQNMAAGDAIDARQSVRDSSIPHTSITNSG